jgi:hypothetical protein
MSQTELTDCGENCHCRRQRHESRSEKSDYYHQPSRCLVPATEHDIAAGALLQCRVTTVKRGASWRTWKYPEGHLNIPVFWDVTLRHVQVPWRCGWHDPYKHPRRRCGDMATSHKTGILSHTAVATLNTYKMRIGSSLSSDISTPTSKPLSAHSQYPSDPHPHPCT